MIYRVHLVLENKFGRFVGKQAELSQENYDILVKMSKTFYVTGGFELTCQDGTFAIFPPDIVKESILIINSEIISDNSEKEENNNV